MATAIRKSPPICLGLSVIRLILGKLRISNQYVGQIVKMQNQQEFTIFRHIKSHLVTPRKTTVAFIVSFKFARLSHNGNRLASIIPMLMISGFPGFDVKLYGVNRSNGYWQGMYQWQTIQDLEEYKKSFVFRMMNRRAITSSLNMMEYKNQSLADFINSHAVENKV